MTDEQARANPELKNCPHCGSNEVEYRRARDNPRAWVLCGNCGAMCDELDTLPEADCVTAWNRRAGETIREVAKLYAYSPTTDRVFSVLEAEPQPASPAPEVEDMCARIKAADDAAADGDYMLDSKDCISVLRGTWKGPLAMDMPAKPSTVEQAINTLVTALAASKGWMRDYADAIIRDAIDRRVPEAMSLNQASGLKDYELERFGGIDPSKPRLSQWEAALMNLDRASPAAPNEAAKNGAEAWKDVPRTGDWVADAGVK